MEVPISWSVVYAARAREVRPDAEALTEPRVKKAVLEVLRPLSGGMADWE